MNSIPEKQPFERPGLGKDDGPFPRSNDELFERIVGAFGDAKEEWQAPFRVVRLIKAYFAFDYQKASEFTEHRLGGYLDLFDLANQWDKVTNPAWCFEILAKACPLDWDHPELNVRNNRCHSRRVAGIAFYLQTTIGDRWFRLGQNQLAEALGITHQVAGRICNALVKTGWLEVRGRHQSLSYRCPPALGNG